MWLALALVGCTARTADTMDTDAVDTDVIDTAGSGWWPDAGATTDPFADAVVSFTPGEGAGYGQDSLPGVVLGPPHGTWAGTPSLDVLSLGNGGAIVLELIDVTAVDGPGPDLLVFENAMPGWPETARVGASVDGAAFTDWPCAADDAANGFPGCAGVHPVFGGPGAADPTDPATAGGEAYDLADIGLSSARFVRIVDTGANSYVGTTGGFDLDAIAVVNAP